MTRDPILTFIRTSIKRQGFPPSVREIALHLGCSTSTVHARLRDLQDAGRIHIADKTARAIVLLDEDD